MIREEVRTPEREKFVRRANVEKMFKKIIRASHFGGLAAVYAIDPITIID